MNKQHEERDSLNTISITVETANAFIAWTESRHLPLPRAEYAIGATESGNLIGVILAGEAEAGTAEISRLLADTQPARIALVRAAWHEAQARGYHRLIIRTAPEVDLGDAGLSLAENDVWQIGGGSQ